MQTLMTSPVPARRRWVRFSLRTVFVLLTLFSVWLGLYRIAPRGTIALSLFPLVGYGTLWTLGELLCPATKAPPQV